MEPIKARLRKEWTQLCQSVEIADEKLIAEWWDVIVKNYCDARRHYHTLRHVLDMMDDLDRDKGYLRDPTAVGFAIFFHDLVYDTIRQGNEQESARLFRQFALKSKLERKSPELVSTICRWIEATMNHNTPELQQDSPQLSDLHYFLDFDLAILGKNSALYDIYVGQIRKEYLHVPLVEYRKKRCLALQSFLDRKHIYTTPRFRDTFEKQARGNLDREIEKHTLGHAIHF